MNKRVPEAGVKILGVYPSPAAREASFLFEVGSTERLEIEVYDVTGRCTARPADKLYPAGSYTVSWNGLDSHGQKVASGVYFFRISGNRTAEIRKFALVR